MGAISRISPYDSLRTNEGYAVWEGIMPLPPASLLWSVGGASLENFLVVADAWDQALASYIRPDTTVFEIGCGCGRSARTLLRHPFVSQYIGFDVIAENIEWCTRFLAPCSQGRARFLHYNLYSTEYNPQAETRASELIFPCEDGSVHLVVASSVFTHLLEPDAAHYLAEIARILAPGGHAALTIHTNVPEGKQFSGTETRIDVVPSYFLEMAAKAGLDAKRQIEDFCGQTLLVLTRTGGIFGGGEA